MSYFLGLFHSGSDIIKKIVVLFQFYENERLVVVSQNT